jgi:protein-S-isoprenylcysteine O-methyltransferase Ste14
MNPVHAVELTFAIGWALFWIGWIAAAFSMKRGRPAWSSQIRVRIPLLIAAVLLVHAGAFRNQGLHSDPLRATIGLILFAAGLAFAVWARVHIGRNWGTPMSKKADPELVTSGPYRFVRHPIYSGILLAGVGTAVALSWSWLFVVALTGAYFIYSATVEERNLAAVFPDTYPAYRRSSKMLVPFIF